MRTVAAMVVGQLVAAGLPVPFFAGVGHADLRVRPDALSVSTGAADTIHEDWTPFELADQGGILVRARLNGAGPFQLLLDTGATHSSISNDVARTLAAPVVARATLATSIGDRLHAVVRLDRFELGPIEAEGLLPSLIIPEGIDATGTIQGVVGQDILAPLRYTIDFRKRRILWGDSAAPAPGSSVFALEPVNGRFVIELPQRDSTLRLVPDTGSGGLVLFVRPDRRFRFSTTPVQGTAELATLTGRRSVQQAMMRELRIGTITWRDVMAVLVERQGADRSEADGLLPLHRFRRVTFDGPRGLLIVQR